MKTYKTEIFFNVDGTAWGYIYDADDEYLYQGRAASFDALMGDMFLHGWELGEGMLARKTWNIEDAKPGDIIASVNFQTNSWVMIVEGVTDACVYPLCGLTRNNSFTRERGCINPSDCRLATNDERERLLTAMHKAGYEWDSENCKLIREEWIPHVGDKYWCFGASHQTFSNTWAGSLYDRSLLDVGNCFRTEAEANAAAVKVRDLLKQLQGQ